MKKRNYNKEYLKEKEKVSRINFKIDKKYNYLLEQIKEEHIKGLSGFLVESIKNYNNGYLKLNTGEGANLIAIVEYFLEKTQNYQDKNYLKQVRDLRDKLDKYVDDET